MMVITKHTNAAAMTMMAANAAIAQNMIAPKKIAPLISLFCCATTRTP